LLQTLSKRNCRTGAGASTLGTFQAAMILQTCGPLIHLLLPNAGHIQCGGA
jgi:hypothetical protein